MNFNFDLYIILNISNFFVINFVSNSLPSVNSCNKLINLESLFFFILFEIYLFLINIFIYSSSCHCSREKCSNLVKGIAKIFSIIGEDFFKHLFILYNSINRVFKLESSSFNFALYFGSSYDHYYFLFENNFYILEYLLFYYLVNKNNLYFLNL